MRKRHAFTLVELLVVIAIIGLLVALLLPAVQAAREAARRLQCKNHLKQISLAFLNHEDTHGFFPTSGWGWRWQGDPDGGFNTDQPGGWAYNILPFLEESVLRDIGRGIKDFNESDRVRLVVVQTPIPIFNCPSRRSPLAYPMVRNGFLSHNQRNCSVSQGCALARSDYAGCSGNLNPNDTPGPGAGARGPNQQTPPKNQNGITYRLSTVRIAEVTDGTSKTAMVGEKYLNPDRYVDGRDAADDQNIFVGHDRDVNGYTVAAPRQDRAGAGSNYAYGSAHPGGFHMALCDGSVQSIDYNIEIRVYRGIGGRDEGSVASESPY